MALSAKFDEFGVVLNLHSLDVVILVVLLGIIIIIVNLGILVAIVGGYFNYRSYHCKPPQLWLIIVGCWLVLAIVVNRCQSLIEC